MEFTADWFTHNVPNFEACMKALDKRELFMEIGSYEGRSTCWLLEHGLADDGEITCIDPYNGLEDVYQRFSANTIEARSSMQILDLIRSTSYDALSWLIQDTVGKPDIYDFIYIDGSHAPDAVLTDACMAWGLLRSGGVMLFDDYLYPHEPTRVGIDGFLEAFGGKYKTIISNYQYGIQKL